MGKVNWCHINVEVRYCMLMPSMGCFGEETLQDISRLYYHVVLEGITVPAAEPRVVIVDLGRIRKVKW